MFLSHPWRSWVHQWACQGLQLTQDARDIACKQSIAWLRPQWSVSHHTGPAGVQGLHISRAAVFWPSGPVIDSMVVAVRGWAAQTPCIPMAHFCHPSLPLLAPEGPWQILLCQCPSRDVELSGAQWTRENWPQPFPWGLGNPLVPADCCGLAMLLAGRYWQHLGSFWG